MRQVIKMSPDALWIRRRSPSMRRNSTLNAGLDCASSIPSNAWIGPGGSVFPIPSQCWCRWTWCSVVSRVPRSTGRTAMARRATAVFITQCWGEDLTETGIERDALMPVVWMNRLSLPVLESSGTAANLAGVRRDFEALSLELTCVDITTDLDIPVVLGVLTDKLNPDFLLVNPVASLSRQQLDRKLDREITQFCRPYLKAMRRHFYRTGSARVSIPGIGQKLSGSSEEFISKSGKRSKLCARFLISGSRRKDGKRPAGAGEPCGVHEELSIVVDRLSRRGYQVIVVNCSVPMIQDLGLHVVKVLIPGLQPVHAGHRYAALGGERLYQVPRLMGLARRDRNRGELNPWPHPFW